LVLAGLSFSLRVDPVLVSQCEKWLLTNQKDLSLLNLVAQNSEISSCQQYCMIAGSGYRTDSTTCRSICEVSGGYERFKSILTAQSGSAPTQICDKLFRFDIPEQENGPITTSFVEVTSTQTVSKKLAMRGDLIVQGTIMASVISSPVGDVKVSGELDVMNQIQASATRTSTLISISGASIKQGIVSKNNQLLIKGKISADSLSTPSLHSSFLEINQVRQWALHSLEDFEEIGDVDGWSHSNITQCGGHRILGGYCVEHGKGEVSKTFTNLPAHSQIRVSAKYMFIDSWDGETGFMKLDNNIVWSENYNHAQGNPSHGINICGNETPERKFGRSVDVTVPHTQTEITVVFGATTDEHPCDESFGIDSVMVFVR